jgi:epoxyqueuosine reductase
VARYATTRGDGSDHYAALRDALAEVADELRAAGYRALVLADDNALVDRAAAQRAGLGWYGKNANLLLPGRGSWFVLGSVVTDAPLGPHGREVSDGCGACRRCLDGCPTGAIVAPGVVDARRCLAWHLQMEGEFPREFRRALGDRIYGCDDCQEVCPPNRRAVPAPGDPPGEASVDVIELLTASDAELLARHGRWYVPRRDPNYLRRNALVVLGNSGRSRPPGGYDEIDDVLVRHLRGPDDLLAAHATWAALRLDRADLLEAAGVAGRDAVVREREAHMAATGVPDEDGGG